MVSHHWTTLIPGPGPVLFFPASNGLDDPDQNYHQGVLRQLLHGGFVTEIKRFSQSLVDHSLAIYILTERNFLNLRFCLGNSASVKVCSTMRGAVKPKFYVYTHRLPYATRIGNYLARWLRVSLTKGIIFSQRDTSLTDYRHSVQQTIFHGTVTPR